MPEPFDVARARAETRGCASRIHFDNAGASLMPIPVVDALHHYLAEEEALGGYETAAREAERLERFYAAGARLIGASADELAFVENATRAFDMAFYGFRFAPGDRILTALSEYGSNVIAYLHRARREGIDVVFVPNDEHGQIDVTALRSLVDERVKLISLSHVPTGGGLVNPAAEVGRVAREAGIPYLLDACQSLGQLPVDVDAIGCDVLCGTGRKYLRGPRGTGVLYVRRSLLERLDPPLLDQHAATLVSPTRYRLRGDARRFENFEQHFGGKAALAVAIDYALSWGVERTWPRIRALAADLRERLAALDGVAVTDEGAERCGIVTFVARQRRPPEIKAALSARGIQVCVSSGSGSLVSFQRRGLTEVVRASLHYYNDETEIGAFVEALASVLREA